MKPLPWIATGLVIVAVTVDVGGYDLLANPLGWVLVLYGWSALPPSLELRTALRWLAALALVVAAVIWVPAGLERMQDADAALRWTADLPQIGFAAALAHTLTIAAGRAGDRRAATWWSLARTVTVAVGALPVLIFGGGLTSLSAVAGALTILTPLLVIALLFSHGSRPWALDAAPRAG